MALGFRATRATSVSLATCGAALMVFLLAGMGQAHAKECGSAKAFAADLWKKYGELALKFGCARSPAEATGHALARTFERCEQDLMVSARIKAGLARHFRKISAVKSVTRHPARLAFASKRGKLTGTFGRTWIHVEPYDLDRVEVEIQKLDGKGKAGVEVCKLTPEGGVQKIWDFTIEPGSTNEGRTWRRSFNGTKGTILSVTVDGKSVAKSIEYALRLRRPAQGRLLAPNKERLPPVQGFADLHAHHMSHLGFVGAWLWPAPDEPLRACTGLEHGRIPLDGYPYRSKHTDRTQPNVDWPHHMDTAHQQMHASHLKQAHDRGLQLIIAPAVSNEWVSKVLILPWTRDDDVPADDMDSARLQIRAMHAFAQKYPWYRIARDPWEARRIIRDGDLAVIIGVEVSNLMPEQHGDWEHQLEELYDMGVRSIEIAHETNTDFAGAAVHHGIKFKIMQELKAAADPKLTFETKDKYHNAQGLDATGRDLIREMARRKMVLEIDHCSRECRKDIYDLVSDRTLGADVARAQLARRPAPERMRYYPLFFSHSRFDALIPSKDELERGSGRRGDEARGIGKGKTGEKEAKATREDTGEYMPLDREVLWVRETGGVFGLRTGPNAMRTYSRSGVQNTCHTSSRSFAQMYAYGLYRFGMALALGSDLNGFVPQTAPRFGAQACSKLANQQADHPRRDSPVGGRTLGAFDSQGLAHIGLESELIQDIDNLGLDVGTLNRSAETFLRMWERTYDDNRGPLDAAGYRRLMGTPAPTDVRPGDANAARAAGGTSNSTTPASVAPTCPAGYSDYDIRNPLNKDRCRRTATRSARLQCRLLVTDKARNWTGPHAQRGADECRSRRGKRPKGVKCPRGYAYRATRGADTCTKTDSSYATPTCPAGYDYKSRRGRDTCEQK